MIVSPIKTTKITANELSLYSLLDMYLKDFSESSVLAITSKVVALCEGRTVPREDMPKQELIRQEASLYLPASNKYGTQFTITQNTLVPNAGIDESNAEGVYVLWPEDSVKSACGVRQYLKERFNITNAGVIITDSTSHPFRLGTSGIVLGFSGFNPTHSYIGEPDLFGRKFTVESCDVATGLAASATLVMGEGAEQTPLAVIQDVPFVTFKDEDPSKEDLATLTIRMEDDLFAPFLEKMPWISKG